MKPVGIPLCSRERKHKIPRSRRRPAFRGFYPFYVFYLSLIHIEMCIRDRGSDSPYQRNDIFIEKTSRFVFDTLGCAKPQNAAF